MTDDFRVLVVDDEELYARAIVAELERREVACDVAYCCAEALARASEGKHQVVLLDHRLPDDDGIHIIPGLLARQPGAAVIMMTAYHTVPDAVEAMRRGAEDYIVKETSIQPIVDRVIEIRRRERARAASGLRERHTAGLTGASPRVLEVMEQLGKIARSPETTVLLTGETGVGKEVAARYLHAVSRPSNSPFVVVDCVALPENLAESLLFGHEKGAFTGADRARPGAFEEAADGTVLLDEIGDMAAAQGKLLRVLESRSFQRLGSVRELPLRARVVAATHQDLSGLVATGRFRNDLYQRLGVYPIHIPPLRERGDDVLLLAEHFLSFFADRLGKEIAPLSDEVASRLRRYDYPGNVRELKNIIERAVISTDTGHIEQAHLPRRVLERRGRIAPDGFEFRPGVDTLESVERRMIEKALEQAGGVKAQAARLLGISRYQLLRRLDRYGLGDKNGGGERS